MKWYTFTIDDEVAREHESFLDARFYAQCTHDTNRAAERCGKQLYQIKRTYIATREAMVREGFNCSNVSPVAPDGA